MCELYGKGQAKPTGKKGKNTNLSKPNSKEGI